MNLSESLREHIEACFTAIWIESHEHEDALAEISQLCPPELPARCGPPELPTGMDRLALGAVVAGKQGGQDVAKHVLLLEDEKGT